MGRVKFTWEGEFSLKSLPQSIAVDYVFLQVTDPFWEGTTFQLGKQ